MILPNVYRNVLEPYFYFHLVENVYLNESREETIAYWTHLLTLSD